MERGRTFVSLVGNQSVAFGIPLFVLVNFDSFVSSGEIQSDDPRFGEKFVQFFEFDVLR